MTMMMTRRRMMVSAFLMLVIVVSGVAAANGNQPDRVRPCRRNMTLGTVNGIVETLTALNGKEVEVYLGIPYAKPPRRLQRAVMVDAWKPSIQEANKLGPACVQYPDSEYIQKFVRGFQNFSEDCLFVNVYRPGRQRGIEAINLPVLVFIHGGSFMVGMGAMFDGRILAAYGDIVVVTFNYRLEKHGFLSSGDSRIPGNLGLLDQVLALQWVNKYISDFGGDPKRVTLGGHSAGAAAVDLHLVSPLSRGLFQRTFHMSGSALSPWTYYNLDPKYWREFVRKARDGGCSVSSSDYIECLNKKGITVKAGIDLFGVTTPPTIDGTFLQKNVDELLKTFSLNANESLMGFTLYESAMHIKKDDVDEGINEGTRITMFNDRVYDDKSVPGMKDLIFHQYKEWDEPANIKKSTQRFLDMLSDYEFGASTHKLAEILTTRDSTVFMYVFAYASPSSNAAQWRSLEHGSDIQFFFGWPFLGLESGKAYVNSDRTLSQRAMGILTRFVKEGHRGNSRIQLDSSLVDWSQFEKDSRSYLVIGDNIGSAGLTKKEKFRPQDISFWNNLLPKLQQEVRVEALPDASAVTAASIALWFLLVYAILSTMLVGCLGVIIFKSKKMFTRIQVQNSEYST